MARPDHRERGRLVGAVLVGGAGARMGRAKHTLAGPDGRSFAALVEAALDPICSAVVTLGPEPVLDGRRAIPDRRPGEGPLAGIESLLHSGLAHDYLVVPCDMPRVTTTLLATLARPSSAPMTMFEAPGDVRPRSLPARMSADLAPVVTALLDAGERAVRSLLTEVEVERRPISVDVSRDLLNINTPEELRALLVVRVRRSHHTAGPHRP